MYIFLDTETTGLNPHNNQILTAYFAILDEDLHQIDDLEIKIKYTNYHINIHALKCNKIDLMSHHDDPTSLCLDDAETVLSNFLRKNCLDRYKLAIVGHNVGFDIRMLGSHGLLDPEFLDIDNPIDTLITARSFKKSGRIKVSSCKLGDLIDELSLNVSTEDLHNAKYDTLATMELYKYFLSL
jgi:DNA polymerase III alpha subunit (gram-positive type)